LVWAIWLTTGLVPGSPHGPLDAGRPRAFKALEKRFRSTSVGYLFVPPGRAVARRRGLPGQQPVDDLFV